MIIQFTVDNFLSFKNKNIINFTDIPIEKLKNISIGNVTINPVTLLYGNVTSGKYDIFKAFKLLKKIILKGAIDDESRNIEELSYDSNRDIYFKIVFSLKDNIYEYVVSFNKNTIKLEYLKYLTYDKSDYLFLRNNYNNIDTEYLTDKNKLFLTYLGRIKKNSLYKEILYYFEYDIIFNLYTIKNYYTYPITIDNRIFEFLKNSSVFIDSIIIDKNIEIISQQDILYKCKLKYLTKIRYLTSDNSFKEVLFSNENKDVIKLINMLHTIYKLINTDKILIIEELFSNLDYFIIFKYLEILLDQSKKYKFQIFTTCNESNFLMESKLKHLIYLVKNNKYYSFTEKLSNYKLEKNEDMGEYYREGRLF